MKLFNIEKKGEQTEEKKHQHQQARKVIQITPNMLYHLDRFVDASTSSAGGLAQSIFGCSTAFTAFGRETIDRKGLGEINAKQENRKTRRHMHRRFLDRTSCSQSKPPLDKTRAK